VVAGGNRAQALIGGESFAVALVKIEIEVAIFTLEQFETVSHLEGADTSVCSTKLWGPKVLAETVLV